MVNNIIYVCSMALVVTFKMECFLHECTELQNDYNLRAMLKLYKADF